jgi:hypothetical protein
MSESIDLERVNLKSRKEIGKFLAKQELPLSQVPIVNKKTGNLYVADGVDLYSLHELYGGEQVNTGSLIPQSWSGTRERTASTTLHSVFYENGCLVDKHGVELQRQLCTDKFKEWMQAMVELTFEGGGS